MVTSNKKEFLEQLKYELNRVGIDQTEEILEDFEEHFADSVSGGRSEEETARNLGDVAEIARNYLNLESCRINSMVARDIEHKKKVSLTKPGQSVPADLNLLNADELKKSDCVREYTPEHISEEIYPNSVPDPSVGNPENSAAVSDSESNHTAGNASGQNNSGNNTASSGSTENSANTGSAGSANVADAFSVAGKAVADAAKVTGKAIAEAFEKSKVKDAVRDAGKSAAEAMRTTSQSAAEAMKKAKEEHAKNKAAHNSRSAGHTDSVPHPGNDFRTHNSNSRKADIPEQNPDIKLNKGFRFQDVKDLQPNVNAGKLVTAILLDIFLWSWLLPAIIACVIAIIAAGAGLAYRMGMFGMWGGYYSQYVFISRVFGGIAFVSLGAIIILIGVCLIKPIIKLVNHIVMLHIKAVYDI